YPTRSSRSGAWIGARGGCSTPTSSSTRSPGPSTCRASTSCCSKSCTAGRPPTRAASASRRPCRPPPPSPTPSTTPSACASAAGHHPRRALALGRREDHAMNSFVWIDVNTPEQAVSQLGAERGGPALLKAGGIDVLDRLKEGLEAPTRLINLRRIGSSLAE